MIGTVDLDHVAIAVEAHRDAWPRYRRDLAGEWLSAGFGIGFAPAQLGFANGMKLEVLQPHRVGENDFLRRFLDRNGPGPHHLTFKVADLDVMLGRTEAAGYRPVGVDRSDPGWKEAFLHPRDIPGVVVQLAEANGTPWRTPSPDGWPEPGTDAPASLDYIAHAVADLDEGMRLFGGLLDGRPTAEGEDRFGRWVELAWPGPGRVRLLVADGASASSPLGRWLGARRGRIHHLAFTCERPDDLAGASVDTDGTIEVPPEANLGTRLILRARQPARPASDAGVRVDGS